MGIELIFYSCILMALILICLSYIDDTKSFGSSYNWWLKKKKKKRYLSPPLFFLIQLYCLWYWPKTRQTLVLCISIVFILGVHLVSNNHVKEIPPSLSYWNCLVTWAISIENILFYVLHIPDIFPFISSFCFIDQKFITGISTWSLYNHGFLSPASELFDVNKRMHLIESLSKCPHKSIYVKHLSWWAFLDLMFIRAFCCLLKPI